MTFEEWWTSTRGWESSGKIAAELAWNESRKELDELRKDADEIERLREALRECADDLEAEIKHRHYRVATALAAEDLKPVERARALLTPNA